MLIYKYSFSSQKAKRFTLEEKILCIGMLRRSRCSYNFLYNHITCPSITTLMTALKEIVINPGCNRTIKQYLQSVSEGISDQDLYCSLIWDEMSIKLDAYYDFITDRIIGFEEWGTRRRRYFADHAIVFYMKCLSSGKHMPLGYGFCKGTTETTILVACIKQWLKTLLSCGFKPVATVCDQGPTNTAAIKNLVATANKARNTANKANKEHVHHYSKYMRYSHTCIFTIFISIIFYFYRTNICCSKE